MINTALLDVAKLATVIPSQTTVNPGDVVSAALVLPLPGDSPALGDFAYSVSVHWFVATGQPAPALDAHGFVTNVGALTRATLGTDYIAPLGLSQTAAVFGLMPPVAAAANGAAPAATPYWLVAEFTVRRPGAVTQATLPLLQHSEVKASPQINAQGLSAANVLNRVLGLFKVEMPTPPLDPGSPISARLRPRGAEDAEWDVDAATEIAPQFDLAAKIPLEPLFKPLSRIVSGVFGIGNQILGNGVRLLTPLVRVIGAVGEGLQAIASAASNLFGGSSRSRGPLSGLKGIGRDLERLLRRLRIRDVDIFRGLELPIDANLVNRNFTKHLVPRDAVPPLPGPSGLLPTVPTLENQLELTDALPAASSIVPVVGSLAIPLSINNVAWELWSTPNMAPNTQLVPGVDYLELDHTAARLFKRTLAIEPPIQADGTVYLRVRIAYTAGTIIDALDLPLVPIRLLRFDPLAFVAQQLQLAVPVDSVEPAETLDVQLLSAIPLDSTSVTDFQVSFPLGQLPLRMLPITIAWEVLDENQQPLAEGIDYGLTGVTATGRSILFVPILQIMRREDPTPLVRYVQVVLTTQNPALQATIGPVPVPVLALQVPLFVALFRQPFFEDRDDDEVQVLLPSFYVTQAPAWTDSWDTFRTRLNDLQGVLGRLLAIAGAGPPAPGANQNLSPAAIRRLTLWRGAFDYVANRAQTGKLEFLQSSGNHYTGYIETWMLPGYGISETPFRRAATIVVVNDAGSGLMFTLDTILNGQLATVAGTPANPVCVVWKKRGWWRYWTSIPRYPAWPVAESVSVTDLPAVGWDVTIEGWDLIGVRASFDQHVPVQNYFRAPAELWYVPPPPE